MSATECTATQIKLIATDGHRLIVIDSCLSMNGGSKNEPFRAQWSRETVEAFCKLAPPAKYSALSLAKISKTLIETSAGSVKMRDVDAQFPPYEQVIPVSISDARIKDAKTNKRAANEPSPIVIGFNCKYLGDIAKISALLGSKKIGCATLELGADALAPATIKIDCEGSVEVTYILMPSRI